MTWVRGTIAFVAVFFIAFSLNAHADEQGLPSKVELNYRELDSSEAADLILSSAQTDSADSLTIVSSDEESLIEKTAHANVLLIPFGRALAKASDAVGGMNQYIQNYPAYAANAIRNDRLGFAITVFTFGSETIHWFHVSSASTFAMTANIVFSAIWTGVFLDKDTYSKVTKPLQKIYRRFLNLSQDIPQTTNHTDMAIKFLSGATITVGMNGVRSLIIGIDQLSQHACDIMNLTTPILMGIAVTAVRFSWSELSGATNSAVYPRSKKLVRLAINARTILTSLFAANVMLMNPETFGAGPWMIMGASGAIGAALFVKARKLLPKIEHVAARLDRVGLLGRVRTCEAVFGG